MMLVCFYHSKPSLFIQRNIQDHTIVSSLPHPLPQPQTHIPSHLVSHHSPLHSLQSSFIFFPPKAKSKLLTMVCLHDLWVHRLVLSLLDALTWFALLAFLLFLEEFFLKKSCTVLIKYSFLFSSHFMFLSFPLLSLFVDATMSHIMCLYINTT